MKKITLEVLQTIFDYGYEAYAVGGYVRDFLLDIKSNDIDITTNATPMELKNIFPDISIPKKNYGSTTLIYKNVRFEITTYRKETGYSDNRHPERIEYVNDLKTDLLRRDFTVNTICMDKDGNIIDLLNGTIDLEDRVLRTVANSDKSFKDDALRILRAIRFSTTHNFKLDNSIIEAINNNKLLLKKLSYERKKDELDHIFASCNAKYGIDLLKELDLCEVLELSNIERIKDYSDLIGIWAMINPINYNFNNSLKELIKKVNVVYNLDNLDKFVLYKYGLYVNVLAGLNKGLNKKKISEIYQNLPIHDRSDIVINANKICEILERKPDSFINDIYLDLEKLILNNELENSEDKIIEYVIKKYKVKAR